MHTSSSVANIRGCAGTVSVIGGIVWNRDVCIKTSQLQDIIGRHATHFRLSNPSIRTRKHTLDQFDSTNINTTRGSVIMPLSIFLALQLTGYGVSFCLHTIWQLLSITSLSIMWACRSIADQGILQQGGKFALQITFKIWYSIMLLPAQIRLFIRPRPSEVYAVQEQAPPDGGTVRKIQCPTILDTGRQCLRKRNEIPGSDSMWFCCAAHRRRWHDSRVI